MPLIENSLLLPHDAENKTLAKLIKGSLKRKQRSADYPTPPIPLAWEAPLFLLEKSTLFNKLSLSQQQAILQACNEFILSESYFIEKSGLAYCAKMLLAGETTEVRQIYALIASHESSHLEWLSPYIPLSLRTCPQGKFIYFISELIEACQVNTLYFLIQTILEGWGIFYYRNLAQYCQIPELKRVFFNLMKDEAIHYKTGLALFSPTHLTKPAIAHIQAGMKGYADILRVGAQNIVQCVEQTIGKLSYSELTRLFEELQTEESAFIKLTALKNIMNQPGTSDYIALLEEAGYFKPYSAEACARIYLCSNHPQSRDTLPEPQIT